MKKCLYFFIVLFVLSFLGNSVNAQTLGERLSGRILIDVERNGEAWYVYPKNNKRYYLGRPNNAFEIMRELGLGVSEIDFAKIDSSEEVGDEYLGNIEFAKRLAGQIILQVEKNGEAWYINPLTYKKHYLGRPDDAFKIMRELGLGISLKNLAYVHKSILDENIDEYSSYKHKVEIEYDNESYYLDVVEINLNNPDLKIITDTANELNCTGRCEAKELVDFIDGDKVFAAINGTYFDTSAEKLNYYFFPVYNSRSGIFINGDQLKYPTTGPIMAFDQNNKFYYFKDSRDFTSVENFEKTYETKLQAAIGNKPRLIEDGKNLLIDWEVDEKQRYVKATRNAIAYKEGDSGSKGSIYLIVARNATVSDLAEILKIMQMDYAINLDGGYSAALFYHDEYMYGPGRNIPNTIMFAQK